MALTYQPPNAIAPTQQGAPSVPRVQRRQWRPTSTRNTQAGPGPLAVLGLMSNIGNMGRGGGTMGSSITDYNAFTGLPGRMNLVALNPAQARQNRQMTNNWAAAQRARMNMFYNGQGVPNDPNNPFMAGLANSPMAALFGGGGMLAGGLSGLLGGGGGATGPQYSDRMLRMLNSNRALTGRPLLSNPTLRPAGAGAGGMGAPTYSGPSYMNYYTRRVDPAYQRALAETNGFYAQRGMLGGTEHAAALQNLELARGTMLADAEVRGQEAQQDFLLGQQQLESGQINNQAQLLQYILGLMQLGGMQ